MRFRKGAATTLTRPGNRLTAWLTLFVVVCILAVGLTYSVVRPKTWESVATVTLVPTPANAADVPDVLDSFERSGVAGTYVELLTSHDTLARAGSPPVDVKASAVQGARAIRVTTSSSDREVVRPALSAILGAAVQEQAKLQDVWTISILETPNAPKKADLPTGLFLVAIVILALLGGISTWVLGRRFFDRTRRPIPHRERIPPEALPESEWLAERGSQGRRGSGYPLRR
jgi:hypothetical protein